jgi:hypothetical protein
MTDIVARLRKEASDTYDEISAPESLWAEAADEIEQLRMERDRALEGKSLANDLVRLLQNEVRW